MSRHYLLAAREWGITAGKLPEKCLIEIGDTTGSHIRSDDRVIVFQSLSLGEQSRYGAFVCILLSLS
jgi:hypothetical protein